jgi:hypothetical protein
MPIPNRYNFPYIGACTVADHACVSTWYCTPPNPACAIKDIVGVSMIVDSEAEKVKFITVDHGRIWDQSYGTPGTALHPLQFVPSKTFL